VHYVIVLEFRAAPSARIWLAHKEHGGAGYTSCAGQQRWQILSERDRTQRGIGSGAPNANS
jgi:hypothetical protein